MEPDRLILFVCTGNTCRSPMAEAIARARLADLPGSGEGLRISSAGVAAGVGEPANPSAIETMQELGIDLRGHQSQPMTPELVDRAEVVYAMTASHASGLRSAFPQAAGKVRTLDPDGDIPDPIGRGGEVYRATAQRLRELIETRLPEMTA